MLSFSSQLPAGKNSPRFLCVWCIYSVRGSGSAALLALTCVLGRKLHLPAVCLCEVSMLERPLRFPRAQHKAGPTSGTYVTLPLLWGHCWAQLGCQVG